MISLKAKEWLASNRLGGKDYYLFFAYTVLENNRIGCANKIKLLIK